VVPMQKDFTQNDLLKYLYAETDIVNSFMIEQALNSNFELKEDFTVFNKSKELLDEVKLSPSKASIDLILAYSRKSVSFEQHNF